MQTLPNADTTHNQLHKMSQKFFTLNTARTAYVRFVIGSHKSAIYEVGHRGMTRRIDVAGDAYTFRPAGDFTCDQSLVQYALTEAETVETLNAFFADEHSEYLAVCAKYGCAIEQAEPHRVSTCVRWIGHGGETLELETAAASPAPTRDTIALEKYGKRYRELPDDGAEQDFIAGEADRLFAKAEGRAQ